MSKDHFTLIIKKALTLHSFPPPQRRRRRSTTRKPPPPDCLQICESAAAATEATIKLNFYFFYKLIIDRLWFLYHSRLNFFYLTWFCTILKFPLFVFIDWGDFMFFSVEILKFGCVSRYFIYLFLEALISFSWSFSCKKRG